MRKFGLTVSVGCGLIGLALALVKHYHTAAGVMYGLGALGGLAGLVGSRPGMWFYRAWMGIGFVLGNIMSRILLAIIYYGLFTPLGLLMRLSLRRDLRLGRPKEGTCWSEVTRAPSDGNWERQF
jgi:hypothetical protein